MVLVQLGMLFLIPSLPWSLTIGLAYCFGGVINHSLMLGNAGNEFRSMAHLSILLYYFAFCKNVTAIHEISHHVAFGQSRPLANKIFGMWANLPIGVPFSISFKKYHIYHHRVRFFFQAIK